MKKLMKNVAVFCAVTAIVIVAYGLGFKHSEKIAYSVGQFAPARPDTVRVGDVGLFILAQPNGTITTPDIGKLDSLEVDYVLRARKGPEVIIASRFMDTTMDVSFKELRAITHNRLRMRGALPFIHMIRENKK